MQTEKGSSSAAVGYIDMNLEVVLVPVSDTDRAKEFYERAGWRLDVDRVVGTLRLIQFTPPGSSCSIQFGTNLTARAPGSAELYLIVSDIEAARAALIARGIDVGEVYHCDSGFVCRFEPAAAGRIAGRSPDGTSYGSFASFSDPDGNTWLIQEVTTRIAGRIRPGEVSFTSADDLARALRRASQAHGEHERRIGAADPNWPDWYALYMVSEQTGGELPA